MSKTTNSKRIFRLIRSLETILPETGLVPPSLNLRIKQAKDITSLTELLWDAFHEEDAVEGWAKIAKEQGTQFSEVQARKQFRDKLSLVSKNKNASPEEVHRKG